MKIIVLLTAFNLNPREVKLPAASSINFWTKLLTKAKYEIRQVEKSLFVTDGKDRASLFPSVTLEEAQKMTEEDCKKVIKKFLAWKKSKK